MRMRYEEEGTVGIALDDVQFRISSVEPEHRYWRQYVQPFLDGGGVIEPYVAPVPTVDERRDARIADGGYGNALERRDVFYAAVAGSGAENEDAGLLAGIRAYYEHIKKVKEDHPREA